VRAHLEAGPSPGQVWPTVASCGRLWPGYGQLWPGCGQLRPSLAKLRPDLAVVQPDLARCGRPCTIALVHPSMVYLSIVILKDRSGEPERGSEWEPIKILFKNSDYEPDFARAPPQDSLAKPT
jgi:hypothetical protein